MTVHPPDVNIVIDFQLLRRLYKQTKKLFEGDTLGTEDTKRCIGFMQIQWLDQIMGTPVHCNVI